jgi:polyferredoxin
MGIDIRDGPQLECIQCALCIDACDEIMEKVGRPPKLIAYDTFRNLDAASHGARAPLRVIRPRTLLYTGALLLAVLIMMLALSAKTTLDVNVQADRNPLFVTLSDGGIRNSYNIRILNKQYETRAFTLELRGLPEARFALLGMEGEATPRIEVAPDNLRTLKAFVTVPREAAGAMRSQAPFEIVVRDLSDGAETSRETVFRGPDK